jgi:hypothetical protein
MVNEIDGKCSTNGQEQDYRRGFCGQNLNRDHIDEEVSDEEIILKWVLQKLVEAIDWIYVSQDRV